MKYIVDGQKLRPYQKDQLLADGSVEFVDIEFLFSNEWDSMDSLVAQFTQNGKTYNQVIVDGKCKLPAEIQDGPVTISVFGYKGAVRGTTAKLPETVYDSGFTSNGETPIPPTPDLYAQLLDQIKGIVTGGPPYIGENGNWFVWDMENNSYADSGIPATGPEGKQGIQGPPGRDGQDGREGAPGKDGQNGKDGSDATVTTDNIKAALGYTPADEKVVNQLSEETSDVISMVVNMMLGLRTGQYYATLNDAINDVNAGTIGVNAVTDSASAVACVYTRGSKPTVVLLKDHVASERIRPSVDMTINLGGHTLSADDAVCIQPSAGNLTIDGRLKGSTVFQDRATTMSVCIQASSSEHTESLNVIGGTYRAKGQTKKVNCFNLLTQSCVYTLSNCEIFADGVDLLTTAVFASGDATVNSCHIEVTCTNSLAYGIYTKSTADLTVNNCLIRAYSNYHYGTDGTMGENNGSMHSVGVRSFGTLIMNNCHVFGTGEGVHSNGSMHINGGTYESYGHGGLYFAATDAVSSARNVITRDCDMPDGYTATAGKSGAGMYISGTNASNQSVYMDNCEIIGERENQTITISSSYGAQNNKLYISNSSIFNRNGGIGRIRIDDDTHRVYIGRGNNFTADDTNNPEAVVVTDEVYAHDIS